MIKQIRPKKQHEQHGKPKQFKQSKQPNPVRHRALLLFLIIVLISAFLTGCIKYEMMSNDEIRDYLENCYGIKITSEKQSDGKDYAIEGKVFTYTTSDGLEFHLSSDYYEDNKNHPYYMDDYRAMWLEARPELTKKLRESEYEWRFYDNLKPVLIPSGYEISIKKFDDIEGALRLACEIVNNDEAIIPGCSYAPPQVDVNSVTPCISFDVFEYIHVVYFRDSAEDKKIDPAEILPDMYRDYVDMVRSGKIKEELDPSVLSEYAPQSVNKVYFDGRDLGMELKRSDNYSSFMKEAKANMFCFYENSEREGNISYLELAKFVKNAGFEVTEETDKVFVLSNGTDQISFGIKDNDFEILKNGEKADVQGSMTAWLGKYQLVLSTDDLNLLFGIKTVTDNLNETIDFTLS